VSSLNQKCEGGQGGELESVRSGRVPWCCLCEGSPGMGSTKEFQAMKRQSPFYFQEDPITVQCGGKLGGRKSWPWTRAGIVTFYWKVCMHIWVICISIIRGFYFRWQQHHDLEVKSSFFRRAMLKNRRKKIIWNPTAKELYQYCLLSRTLTHCGCHQSISL